MGSGLVSPPAVLQGDDNSQEALGEFYAAGLGVAKINIRAQRWFAI